MHVTFANNTEMSHNLDRGGSQHVVFLVAKSLRGRDDNTVTSVYTEGVEVFHVANRNAVAHAIAHNLPWVTLMSFLYPMLIASRKLRASQFWVHKALLASIQFISGVSRKLNTPQNLGSYPFLISIPLHWVITHKHSRIHTSPQSGNQHGEIAIKIPALPYC